MEELKEFRCKFCHRLLAKVGEAKKIEIKCPKCKTMNLFSDNSIYVLDVSEDYLRKKIQKDRIRFDVLHN